MHQQSLSFSFEEYVRTQKSVRRTFLQRARAIKLLTSNYASKRERFRYQREESRGGDHGAEDALNESTPLFFSCAKKSRKLSYFGRQANSRIVRSQVMRRPSGPSVFVNVGFE